MNTQNTQKQTHIYEKIWRGPFDGKPFLQTVRTCTNLNLDLEILFLEWKAEWIITEQGHNIMDDIVYKMKDNTKNQKLLVHIGIQTKCHIH